MNKKNITFFFLSLLALFLAIQVWVWLRYAGAFWLSDSLYFMEHLLESVTVIKTTLLAFLILVVPAPVVSLLFHRNLPYGMRIIFYALLGASCSELYLLFMANFNLAFISRHVWVYLAAGSFSGITYGFILELPWGSLTSSGHNAAVSHKRRKILGSVWLSVGSAGLLGSLAGPSYFWANRNNYIDVNVDLLEEGQRMTVEVGNKPVWILKRSPEMIRLLKQNEQLLLDPRSEFSQQPEQARNNLRSIRPEYLVVYGICTHLGCSPTYRPYGMESDEPSPSTDPQFFCPCHGGAFDLAGRVFKGTPPPENLIVPPHKFVSEDVVRLYFPSLAKEWNV